MNFKWIVPIVLAACGLLYYAYWSAGPEQPRKASPEHTRTTPAAEPSSTLTPKRDPVPSVSTAAAAAPAPATPLPDNASKEQVLESIHLASISYDPVELPRIQPFLTHPDPEIREAALSGVVVLGDAAGAPLLRNAARTLADPREVKQLLEKADWLELPSVPPQVIKTRPAQPNSTNGGN